MAELFDGLSFGWRTALLSVTTADEIETFDVFHGLVYGAPVGGVQELRFRVPGENRDKQGELPALMLAQRQAFIKQIDYRSDAPV
jgi:hypothetical protein